MTDQREAVARVLAEKTNGGTWEVNYTHNEREVWRARADAAIAAMNLPPQPDPAKIEMSRARFELAERRMRERQSALHADVEDAEEWARRRGAETRKARTEKA